MAEEILPLGHSRVYEKEYIRKDGTVFPVELRTFLLRGEADEPMGMWAIVRDISERKQAEEILRASEKAYRDLVENLNDAVFTLNVAGRISYVSPAIERVLGFSQSDVVGEHYSQLVHPGDQAAILKAFRDVYGGLSTPGEFRFRAKSGEYRWLRCASRPLVEDGRVEGLTGVLTDITERKRPKRRCAEPGTLPSGLPRGHRRAS